MRPLSLASLISRRYLLLATCRSGLLQSTFLLPYDFLNEKPLDLKSFQSVVFPIKMLSFSKNFFSLRSVMTILSASISFTFRRTKSASKLSSLLKDVSVRFCRLNDSFLWSFPSCFIYFFIVDRLIPVNFAALSFGFVNLQSGEPF